MRAESSYTGQFLRRVLDGREATQPADVINARAKNPLPAEEIDS
jgi:hypothetical protein